MCRMIGGIANIPLEQDRYLKQLKVQSEFGNRAPHSDGWGIAYLAGNQIKIKKTEKSILTDLEPLNLNSTLFLAHSRKIGKGGVPRDYNNTHPFYHEGFAFAHNGTFYDGVLKNIKGDGETDSEKLFLHLLNSKEPMLSIKLKTLKDHGFNSMNFIMINSQNFYVHRFAKESEEYYTIYEASLKRNNKIVGYFYSTEPFKDDDLHWTLLGNQTLIHIKNGSTLRYKKYKI